MQSRPKMFDEILIIGGGVPPSSGPGVAKIGGTWSQPNLGLSYLLAARHVIEAGQSESRLNEVALPAAFLQRHALEVALKDLLNGAYQIKRDADWWEALKKDAKSRPVEAAQAPFKHDFDALLDKLQAALAAIGFGDIPDEIVTMAKRLGAAETFEPTRFRYLTLRSGEQSFPNSVHLQVGETQDQLETLFERVFSYQGYDAKEPNLLTSMAHESEALGQAIRNIVPWDDP